MKFDVFEHNGHGEYFLQKTIDADTINQALDEVYKEDSNKWQYVKKAKEDGKKDDNQAA